MKTKHNLVATAMRMAFLTAATTGVSHAQLVGGFGVDLQNAGFIYGAPAVEGGLAVDLSAAAEYVLPASAFTGVKTGGGIINYNDLLPLSTSSIKVVTGAGAAAPTGTSFYADGSTFSAFGPTVAKFGGTAAIQAEVTANFNNLPAPPRFGSSVIFHNNTTSSRYGFLSGNNLGLVSHSNGGVCPGFETFFSRGVVGAPEAATSGSNAFIFRTSAYNGTSYATVGQIRFKVDDDITPEGIVPGRIEFLVSDTAVAGRASVMYSNGTLRLNQPAIDGIPGKAILDVNGYVKVGSVDEVADAAPVNGTIRYDDLTHKFQGYANGVWVDLH